MADPEEMPRFGVRIGAVVVPIQVRSMNAALRNSLWNLMRELIPSDELGSRDRSRRIVEVLTVNVLRYAAEGIDTAWPRAWLAARVQEAEWYTVYELLEFTATSIKLFSPEPKGIKQEVFHNIANAVLRRENAGYRFVNGILTEVTSSADIAAIEKAIRDAESHGFGPVREHIRQALELLGKRPEPDNRNAIKEAISAVEAAANLIHGDKKRTLDPVLDLLEASLNLHPAFKSALSKLYGYTSDDSGIRHALMEEASVNDADARFFIIACSGFVSWLIEKADQAGLLKPKTPHDFIPAVFGLAGDRSRAQCL